MKELKLRDYAKSAGLTIEEAREAIKELHRKECAASIKRDAKGRAISVGPKR